MKSKVKTYNGKGILDLTDSIEDSKVKYVHIDIMSKFEKVILPPKAMKVYIYKHVPKLETRYDNMVNLIIYSKVGVDVSMINKVGLSFLCNHVDDVSIRHIYTRDSLYITNSELKGYLRKYKLEQI